MPTDTDIAIEIDRIGKTFARRRSLSTLLKRPLSRAQRITALDEASLTVRRGEIFGLLGPNGAGKTTLLKILSCLILPNTGRARVNGHDVGTQEMAVKRSIGYVASDERSFYWRLTGAQNLSFFARLLHVPAGEIPGRVAHLLAHVDLTGKAGEPFSAYSSGMKQRLAIARALLHNPPILYLDEPTRSLDPVTARNIRDFVVNELAAGGRRTILLATHNLHEAAALCDRMAIMAAARVHRVGHLDEFRSLAAAGRRYRVLTDGPVDMDGVARTLESGPVPGGGHGHLVEVDGEDLAPLLAHLARSGAAVRDLTREEPSLDDLFQQLFRDAEDAGRRTPA